MAKPFQTKTYGSERQAILNEQEKVYNEELEAAKKQAKAQARADADKKAEADKRTRRASVMLREADYMRLRMLAAADDKTLSTYLENVLTSYLAKLDSGQVGNLPT